MGFNSEASPHPAPTLNHNTYMHASGAGSLPTAATAVENKARERRKQNWSDIWRDCCYCQPSCATMQRHKIAQESRRPEYLLIAMGLVVNTKEQEACWTKKILHMYNKDEPALHSAPANFHTTHIKYKGDRSYINNYRRCQRYKTISMW
jgi:hypothetical protein